MLSVRLWGPGRKSILCTRDDMKKGYMWILASLGIFGRDGPEWKLCVKERAVLSCIGASYEGSKGAKGLWLRRCWPHNLASFCLCKRKTLRSMQEPFLAQRNRSGFEDYFHTWFCDLSPRLSGVIRANRKFEWFVRIGLMHYKNRGFNCELFARIDSRESRCESPAPLRPPPFGTCSRTVEFESSIDGLGGPKGPNDRKWLKNNPISAQLRHSSLESMKGVWFSGLVGRMRGYMGKGVSHKRQSFKGSLLPGIMTSIQNYEESLSEN